MGLPKIDIVTFTTELPSNKQKIIYRPFLVKEEKILLMAAKGDSQDDQINAIKQIINNCVQTEIDVDKIPLFDLEWLFLQLRIQSVGDVLDEFVKRREHMFMVKDEFGQVTGLITLEDAIETLLGVEIVDETDSVVDMRKLALDNWRKKRRNTQE